MRFVNITKLVMLMNILWQNGKRNAYKCKVERIFFKNITAILTLLNKFSKEQRLDLKYSTGLFKSKFVVVKYDYF